jgi:hypothetical protein
VLSRSRRERWTGEWLGGWDEVRAQPEAGCESLTASNESNHMMVTNSVRVLIPAAHKLDATVPGAALTCYGLKREGRFP